MKVLVACEYSGTVRDAFAAKGHDAWSCDILPSETKGNHIQDDILKHLDKGWDMMIAHPPCTYLSNAGARHLYPKGELNKDRLKLGLEGKEFFMSLYNANINKICIENPIPSKVFELPNYSTTIQPYNHGHQVSKKTCLWLKNLSLLIPSNIVEKKENCHGAKGSWYNKGGKDRWKRRSKTFEGIAKAMADQWGSDK